MLQDKALARMREKGLEQLPWNAVSENFLARCRFLEKSGQVKDWPAFDDEHLLANAAQWLLPAGRWNGTEVWNEQNLLHGLKLYLGEARLARLNELAPDILRLPAGFKKMVNYTSGEVPKLSARVQEFFGCRTTPTVAGQPLMLDILSPANRTIQLTRDLANFWETTYPGIKKQFEAKYPKHPWPDDPGNKKYVKYK